MRSLILLSAFVLSGCAHEDPWSTRDTWMQVGATTAIAVDAYTTSNIQYTPKVHEFGPIAKQILGRQPTTSDTWQYFTTLAISHYFIVRALPSKWRPYWQGATMLGHVYWVRSNCEIGLCR